MKILFLDVDGVLNKWGIGHGTKERSPHGTMGVEPDKCALIERILVETGANLVVSSTWRIWDEMMDHLLDRLGPQARARLLGKTPVNLKTPDGRFYVGNRRGQEIQAWLNEHPDVTKFVILDDDADMAHLMTHLIQTDGRVGLTEKIAQRVVERLNDQGN